MVPVEKDAVAHRRTYTILAVDDQRSILDALDVLLEDCDNYKLLLADRADSALEMARAHEIDLVLLDLIMPDVVGDELLVDLHRLCGNIVVISALRNLKAFRQMLEIGVCDYILKPFDIDEVTEKIANALEVDPCTASMASSTRINDALINWRT